MEKIQCVSIYCLKAVVPKLVGATPRGGAARLRDSVQSADYFAKETSAG